MAQITYTKSVNKPTASEDEIRQMEVTGEVVGINKMSLVHDVIRALYEKAFKEQTPITFAPPLSSQLSALRHGHSIDPGWVEVQKVLLDQVEQCCHRWPRNRLMSPPQGQHPRMATFGDNIDAIARWVKDAMTNGFSEVMPAKHIDVAVSIVADAQTDVKKPGTGEDFQATVEVPLLLHLYNHLAKGDPLPDGVLSSLKHAIDTAPGPIDLSDHMELLSENGWTICTTPRAEIDGKQYIAKTRRVIVTPEKIADMTATGLTPSDDYRGSYLRMGLMLFETERPEAEKILHGAILTPVVMDGESFDVRRAVLLRVLEQVSESAD